MTTLFKLIGLGVVHGFALGIGLAIGSWILKKRKEPQG